MGLAINRPDRAASEAPPAKVETRDLAGVDAPAAASSETRLLDDPGHCSETHTHVCRLKPGHGHDAVSRTTHQCRCGMTWSTTAT